MDSAIYVTISEALEGAVVTDKYVCHVKVIGRIKEYRSQKKMTFIQLVDGSSIKSLQIVFKTQDFPNLSLLSRGATIKASGELTSSIGTQDFEVYASDLKIIGKIDDPATYPLVKEMDLKATRSIAHLRSQMTTFKAVLRVRSKMFGAIEKYFSIIDFLHVDPPQITTALCEGGAEVFRVLESEPGPDFDWSKEHFGKPAYLTESSQLQLEALCCSTLSPVWCMQKSFRAEHSKTYKHASEFMHLEIEWPESFEDLMDLAQKLVKYLSDSILIECPYEMEFLDQLYSKSHPESVGLIDRISKLVSTPFKTLTHRDAMAEMIQAVEDDEVTFETPPTQGEDLASEHEKYLTSKYGTAVFITEWPLDIKAFYMKQGEIPEGGVEEDRTCKSFDLLIPEIGELFGGSQREEDLQKLETHMGRIGMDAKPLQWYLDLRRYGTIPHGGFGMGVDRLMAYLTGMPSIKEVIPFPVSYGKCDF